MFSKILVPVDLAHTEKMGKALECASSIAKSSNASVCIVGVTSTAPGPVAHTPEEFKEVLRKFGASYAAESGVSTGVASYVSHDPAAELNHVLLKAASDVSADLIVMASHIPGLPEHIFKSHAGAVASHAPISVLVVR